MAIVSCPECSKKLKVADTSVGKKVKCTCGKIFVAEAQDSAPSPVAAASDKVMVACGECGAKLKVAATSLGKKMKCPKCTGVFTAAAMEEAAAPPPQVAPPPAEPEPDPDPPAPVKKGKAVSDDDMEDLFSFAQDSKDKGGDEESPFLDDDEDDKPKAKAKKADPADMFEDEDEPKPKGKIKLDDDDDDMPRPKGKKKPADDDSDDDMPKSKFGAKKSAKPSRGYDDDDAPAEKPIYPRRLLLNLFVFMILIGYVTFFALIFIDFLPDLGLPKHNPRPTIIRKAGVEDDYVKLEGTWTVESYESHGKVDKQLEGKKFVFAVKTVSFPGIEGVAYSLEQNMSPKQLNVVISDKFTLNAIYDLDEDKLTICTNENPVVKDKDGKEVVKPTERPTKFDSHQGPLWVLKREKKKDDADKDKEKDKDKNKQEAVKLNGAWRIQFYEIDGDSLPDLVGEKYTFVDGKLTAFHPEVKDAPFTVDAGKDPMWIDLPKDKHVHLGVYQLDGDTLKICFNVSKRPTKLDSKQGELLTLKRDKKAAGKDANKDKDADPKVKNALTEIKLADFAGTWKIDGFFIKGKGLLIEKLELSIQPDGQSEVAYTEKTGSDFKLSAAKFRVRHERTKNDQAKTETSVTMIDSFLGLQWLLILESKTKLKLIAIIPAEKAPLIEEFILTKGNNQDKGKDKDAKDTARESWQDDFDVFVREWDKAGEPIQFTAEKHSKKFEAKSVTWKLKFIGFRENELGISIEFDLESQGIVEPKRASSVLDPKWKRAVIMDFKPSKTALPEWKKLKPGAVVTFIGTFERANGVGVNERWFAIVNVLDVVLVEPKNQGKR